MSTNSALLAHKQRSPLFTRVVSSGSVASSQASTSLRSAPAHLLLAAPSLTHSSFVSVSCVGGKGVGLALKSVTISLIVAVPRIVKHAICTSEASVKKGRGE